MPNSIKFIVNADGSGKIVVAVDAQKVNAVRAALGKVLPARPGRDGKENSGQFDLKFCQGALDKKLVVSLLEAVKPLGLVVSAEGDHPIVKTMPVGVQAKKDKRVSFKRHQSYEIEPNTNPRVGEGEYSVKVAPPKPVKPPRNKLTRL